MTQVPGLEIFVRTAIVYFVVLFGLRITGKRQIGQMSPFDLVLLLLISNAVQNAMTGPDTSVTGGVIAALTLLGLNVLVTFYVHQNKKLGRLLGGSPSLLIYDGKVIEEHLRSEHISRDELLQAIREHGFSSFGEIQMAVLEIDGAISVVKKEDVKHAFRTKHRFRYLDHHR